MDPRTLQAAERVMAWRRAQGLPFLVNDAWSRDEADALPAEPPSSGPALAEPASTDVP